AAAVRAGGETAIGQEISHPSLLLTASRQIVLAPPAFVVSPVLRQWLEWLARFFLRTNGTSQRNRWHVVVVQSRRIDKGSDERISGRGAVRWNKVAWPDA
ncbi:hypothetical protein PFISCL1PPCAC_592, partial [Pristionchus fissidentatus]